MIEYIAVYPKGVVVAAVNVRPFSAENTVFMFVFRKTISIIEQ